MPLSINQQAPDFTLPSTSGRNFTLSQDIKGRACVIYFYPKDFTPGCTKEACEFRDTFSLFRNMNIPVFGISRDPVETHLEFQKAHKLPFDLLADTEGKVAELYKAAIPLIRFTRRITYLLDKDHRIAACYENLFGAEKHIHQMIEQVKKGMN